MRTLYILSHDLRKKGNPILDESLDRNDIVFPIFMKDTKLEKLSGASLWWVKDSLKNLSGNLRVERIPIVESNGNYIHILKQIVNENNIQRIVSQVVPYANSANGLDEIKGYFTSKGIGTKWFEPNNLLSSESILKLKINFGNFKQFCSTMKNMTVNFDSENEKGLPEIREVEHKSENHEYSKWERDLSGFWNTGEEQARLILGSIVKDGNANKGNSVLSPYIRHGQVNVKAMWKALGEEDNINTEAIKRSLLWREFFYCSYARRPESSSISMNRRMENFRWSSEWSRLINWKEGKTGFPIIDASMRELWGRGWIGNQKRLLVSDFLAKLYSVKWTFGAEWFMDTLVDADEASNYSSWQWISGCSDFSWPFFKIYNPLKKSRSLDPYCEYVKMWVPELNGCPVEYILNPEKMPSDPEINYKKPDKTYKEMREMALSGYKKFNKNDNLS